VNEVHAVVESVNSVKKDSSLETVYVESLSETASNSSRREVSVSTFFASSAS